VASLGALLDAVVPGALAPAEAQQATGGGGNPRFREAFGAGVGGERGPTAGHTCGVVSDHAELAEALRAALAERGVTVRPIAPASGFEAAASALAAAVDRDGPLDAVVVAPAARRSPVSGWEELVDDHGGEVDGILDDAGWARAVSDHVAHDGVPVRLVTLTDAVGPGGRSRAQASAQLARAGRRATEQRVAAFAVSVESAAAEDVRAAGQVAAHLACHSSAPEVSGAELAVGRGWLGLRSHPRPAPAITLGGAAIPRWFDEVLAEALGVETVER
jgi:hypothetical protein